MSLRDNAENHVIRGPPDFMASATSSDDTTELFLALRGGDRRALDHLFPLVYEELHRIAHRELVRRGGASTMGTTGLLHEAYVKLIDASRVDVEDRAHFFALAATAMRQIVIDHARKGRTQKRGGGWQRITLDDALPASEEQFDGIIELEEALQRLGRFDDRLARVVECRFFGGMTVEETARALEVAPRTIDRAWEKAKAWLYREISDV